MFENPYLDIPESWVVFLINGGNILKLNTAEKRFPCSQPMLPQNTTHKTCHTTIAISEDVTKYRRKNLKLMDRQPNLVYRPCKKAEKEVISLNPQNSNKWQDEPSSEPLNRARKSNLKTENLIWRLASRITFITEAVWLQKHKRCIPSKLKQCSQIWLQTAILQIYCVQMYIFTPIPETQTTVTSKTTSYVTCTVFILPFEVWYISVGVWKASLKKGCVEFDELNTFVLILYNKMTSVEQLQ